MHERRRLLLVLPQLDAGGAQRVLLTLAQKLARPSFEICLAVCNLRDAVLLPEVPHDIELINLDCPKVTMALPKLIGLIWQRRPHVVFTTMEHMIFALGATRPLWPRTVRLITRPTIMLGPALKERSHPALRLRLARWVIPRSDVVVFQSTAMQAEWCATLHWRGDRSVVIRNPIDLKKVLRLGADPAVNPGYDRDAINLVASGRLEPQKGFDLALEALSLLDDQRVQLTILGEGTARAGLARQISRLGLQHQVRLLGHIANPFPYYAGADGFVLCSRYEGFPNVVLEALACGTPVVWTPTPGLDEIVRLIPGCVGASGSDVGSLTRALAAFKAAPPVRVPAGHLSQFSADAVLASYENLFQVV